MDAEEVCGVIVYKATYKCRYCEQKSDSKYHYCGLDDAVHHFDSCMKFQPVHFCKGGHVGIDLVGSKGLMRMNDIDKIAHSLTCAGFDHGYLRVADHYCGYAEGIWFTLFRILL